ncbi:MAG: hypothetical protein V4593_08270 [Pseudomonadota bacterium]
MSKKKIAAILAAVAALVALAQQFLAAVPDAAPAPSAHAVVAADAGVPQ